MPIAVLHTTQTPGWGTTIDVQTDGKHGLFLFDTGGGLTVVSPQTAALIGCKPWGQVTGFRLAGDRVDLKRCDDAHIRIGATDVVAPIAGIFDINAYAEGAPTKLAGSLALDVFAGEAITIRPAAHQIVIESADSLCARVRDAHEIKIRIVRDAEGVALSVDAAVSTRDGLAWMELDTGNAGQVAIGRHIASLFGLSPAAKSPTLVRMQLSTGIPVQDLARVGDFIMDGDIGASFLNHWDLTLDLANGKAWLKPALL